MLVGMRIVVLVLGVVLVLLGVQVQAGLMCGCMYAQRSGYGIPR